MVFPLFLYLLKRSTKGAKMPSFPTVNRLVVMHWYCLLLAHGKQYLGKLWAKLFIFVNFWNLLLKIVYFSCNVEVQQGVTELSYHSGTYNIGLWRLPVASAVRGGVLVSRGATRFGMDVLPERGASKDEQEVKNNLHDVKIYDQGTWLFQDRA